jgi:hypothetical protein
MAIACLRTKSLTAHLLWIRCSIFYSHSMATKELEYKVDLTLTEIISDSISRRLWRAGHRAKNLAYAFYMYAEEIQMRNISLSGIEICAMFSCFSKRLTQKFLINWL